MTDPGTDLVIGGTSRWWQRLTDPGRPSAAARAPWAPRAGALRRIDALALLNGSDEAVIAVDHRGVCRFANPSAQQLFELSAHDMVGCGAHLLVPRLAVAVQSLIDSGGPGATPDLGAAVDRRSSAVELTAVRRGGSTFPARVRVSAAYSRRRLMAVVGIHDLSAERASIAATRALLDDVHELRAVVSAVTAAVTDRAIILTDAQGHITAFNRAAEKLLGYRAQDVIGRPTMNLSDPGDLAAVRAELGTPAGVDPLLEITRSGLLNHQDWTFLTRDGERRPVSVKISAIGDRDAPSGFVWVAGDRSARWEPLTSSRSGGDRLLLDLDDAETRTLRWQVGGSGLARRR